MIEGFTKVSMQYLTVAQGPSVTFEKIKCWSFKCVFLKCHFCENKCNISRINWQFIIYFYTDMGVVGNVVVVIAIIAFQIKLAPHV